MKTLKFLFVFTLLTSQAIASNFDLFELEHDPEKISTLTTYLGQHKEPFSDEAQKAYYQKLLTIRNEGIPGNNSVGKGDLETLYFLTQKFRDVTTGHEGLNERAALNLANALVGYADETETEIRKPFEEFGLNLDGIVEIIEAGSHIGFYQEGYCLFTLLAERARLDNVKKAASRNAKRLLKQKKIAPAKKSSVKRALASSFITEEMARQIAEGSLKMEELGNGTTFDPKVKEKKIRRFMQRIIGNKAVSPMLIEREVAASMPPAHLTVTNETFSELSMLLDNVYDAFRTTTRFDDRQPILVPVGRSVGWLIKLHEKREKKNSSGIQVKHILASGLYQYIPTEEQKRAYKAYLDSLGFDDLSNTSELVFLDIADTGTSLKVIQELFEEFYPDFKGHTQALAIMDSWSTTSLTKTRTLYAPSEVRGFLINKHLEYEKFSLFSAFYPYDWAQGDPMKTFKVPQDALNIDSRLQRWFNAS